LRKIARAAVTNRPRRSSYAGGVSEQAVEQWIRDGQLRRAAAWLVASYGSDVMATCRAMVRDPAAAEDVAQEAFSDALRALGGFRGESSARTWLLSIARNRCIDYLRARKRDPWARAGGGAAGGDDAAGDPDAHPDQGALGADWLADRSVLLRALDALGEGDRALVTLRFRNGLEYDELATAFGLREGTVRMRVSRALARMREAIAAAEAPAAAGVASAAAPPPAPAAASRAFGGPARARHAERGVATFSRGGAPAPAPASTLGAALAACEPLAMSEALTTRLQAMVASLPG
jgi:RNA polymerase sigma-70 factor (ECF subfamily)